jgi:hypothetical protein
MNVLTGICEERIVRAIEVFRRCSTKGFSAPRELEPFGDGSAARQICEDSLALFQLQPS